MQTAKNIHSYSTDTIDIFRWGAVNTSASDAHQCGGKLGFEVVYNGINFTVADDYVKLRYSFESQPIPIDCDMILTRSNITDSYGV